MSTAIQDRGRLENQVKNGATPVKFFETMQAYQRSAALKAGIELELFTAIGDGSKTVEALAEKLDASQRGVRILCDFLVVLGFLTKRDDQYGLTADAAVFLDKKSPAYAGDAVKFLASPTVMGGFSDLATVVRTGKPLAEKPFVDNENQAWVDFARGMAPLAFVIAQAAEKILRANSPMKILDVAAGHGMFGIALARENPQATIMALDWPAVLVVAQENAERWNVSQRLQLLAGDAREAPLGTGFDLVLLPNILHQWDRGTIQQFLDKARAALVPGGRIAIIELAPNHDRVSPPISAAFALNMLANTPTGDAYTVSEYQEMLGESGLFPGEVHALAPTPHRLIVGIKRS